MTSLEIATLHDFGIVDDGEAKPLAAPSRFGSPHFRCLGVDGTTCFFQPANVAQVIELSASAMKGAGMFRLAPLHWWEFQFPGRQGVDWNAAGNACMAACVDAGVFDERRIIGRGVYVDPSSRRTIAHLGNSIVVDGESHHLSEAAGNRIFIERPPSEIPSLPPLSSIEARRLLALFEKLSWVEPDMGRLMAGWCVIALLCGSLAWRPHIWVSGPAGSGKSYLACDLIGALLNGTSLMVAGSATEAGIRQALGPDCLPVIIDEAEGKDDDAAKRMSRLIELARSSASRGGAEIRKGGAGGRSSHYTVKSAFLFSSIDPAITQTADESRILQLRLHGHSPNASPAELKQRGEAFAEIQRERDYMIRADFGPRLFWRSLKLLNTILLNSETLASEITARTGNGRLADLLAPCIAGWYSLASEKRILPNDAKRLLIEWRWLGGAIGRAAAEPDYTRALRHLLTSQITIDGGARRTIGELAEAVTAESALAETAREALKRHGLRVDDGKLLICRNSGPVKAMFAATQWRDNPVRTIAENPLATVSKNPVRFGLGIKERAVCLDLVSL